jgi:ABC-type antimicrobial peptide transport system permease subunit
MFYLQYVRNELVRRRSRTILTMLGLAVGVALVIVIASLSRGLDRAQHSALDPLAQIGTDLTVTLQPEDQRGGGFARGPGGFGGGGQLLQANQAAITDLSKLGKPGQHFVHDFFLPGTQLTFPASQAKQIASLPGVSAVSAGLLLSGVHQEGTVPKIVARIQTGGQRIQIRRRITPPSPQEFAKIQACLQ